MIRQLTIEDWPAMEAIVDTRKHLQGVGMSDELHAALKVSIQRRLQTEGHLFYGYFVEDSLEAMCTYVRWYKRLYCGGTWTRAGNTLPKWEDTPWAAALIEIRDAVIAEYDPDFIYRLFPVSETFGSADAQNNLLFDNYNKNYQTTIPAFMKPEDPAVWKYLFVESLLPLDQMLYIYTHKRMPPLPTTPPAQVGHPLPGGPPDDFVPPPVPE